MTFSMDQLLWHLGKPGRYQLLVCILLYLNNFQIVFNHLANAFFGAAPLGYRCGGDGANNLTETESLARLNGTSGVEFCPIIKDSKEWCVPDVRDNCHPCNHTSLYVGEEREITINMEFNLVCDDAWYSNLAASIYFLGVMVGGVVFGYFADAFGRLPVLIITTYGPLPVAIGLFFVPNYAGFAILRFIMGFLMQGLQIVIISLITEYFSPKHRAVATPVVSVTWGIGGFVLALIAFLVRDWRWIQLTFSLLIVITVFYIWLIPESLRWLLSKRKYERAKRLTSKIARYNGLQGVPVEVDALLKEHEESDVKAVTYNVFDLFKNRYTLLKSIILWVIWLDIGVQGIIQKYRDWHNCLRIWMVETQGNMYHVGMTNLQVFLVGTVVLPCYMTFSVSLGYFGLFLSTGTLYGFKYTNFLIGAGVEIGAYTLGIVILFNFGRRIPLMVTFLVGGIACIVSGTITVPLVKTVLALVGRFGIAGAFSVMYLYTSELYPTLIRSVGIGSCMFFTRVGGLVAPQINLLGTVTYKPLPIIIFGVFAIVAGFLALLLPETLNRKLPDTMEESEEMGWGCTGCRRNKKYSIGEENEMPSK